MYLLCMLCYDAYKISHECRVLEIKKTILKKESIYIYRELLYRRVFNIIFSIINM